MTYKTLITAAELQALLATGARPVLLDCSFDLSDPGAGERAHAQGHVPGAIHAHLDRDLSGTKTGRNGRHPLPDREAFAVTAGRWGITPSTQVVCYDDQGSPYAARAWWMLRWIGHPAVAVLDGGVRAWRQAGGAWVAQPSDIGAAPPYPLGTSTMATVDTAAVAAQIGRLKLIDARAAERFRGDVEPLDPVAGHIPGALNRFFKDNLQADGRFKPVPELRASFDGLGAVGPATAHQCGSGVTACHNLLAMEHAGLAGSALYPGSWSEWCADPARPVARS